MSWAHQTLGVPLGASAAEIKSAYRKLARQYHPDVCKAVNAEQRMCEINNAYAALTGRSQPRRAPQGFGFSGAGFRFDFGDGSIEELAKGLFEVFAMAFVNASRTAPRKTPVKKTAKAKNTKTTKKKASSNKKHRKRPSRKAVAA